MLQHFFGCLLYGDNIILLSHSVNATHSVLKCELLALDVDVECNTPKKVSRIGERRDVSCVGLYR